MKKLVAALGSLLVAACNQPSSPPAPTASVPPPPPAQTAAATPARATSAAQVAPGRWDVERVRCSDVLGASDDDRAASMMFYYGYLAAKANLHVIDVTKIEGNVRKVMDQCAATPAMTMPHAFRTALLSRHS
jgi:hypothetical protein